MQLNRKLTHPSSHLYLYRDGKRVESFASTWEDLEKCLTEQRTCADYLLENGPHKGAELGLADWVMEEVILFGDEYKDERT